ncbi:MAG: hypothetical protein PHU46_14035 [Rhodocyclaceae bacterium]|nr:hypothetical protein [Rhodocyclaceae bacterium]
MPRFPDSVRAWPSPAFSELLKKEIESLPVGALPLEQALSLGSYPADEAVSVSILRAVEEGPFILVALGVFFSEVNAGCSCGFDPVFEPAYCEYRLTLSRESGEGEFRPLSSD